MSTTNADTIDDDTRPFPIQGHDHFTLPSRIPWWLAQIAYDHYHKMHPSQSMQRLADRGGFGRDELIRLLRGQSLGTTP